MSNLEGLAECSMTTRGRFVEWDERHSGEPPQLRCRRVEAPASRRRGGSSPQLASPPARRDEGRRVLDIQCGLGRTKAGR